jgi:hypothetical protein
MLLSKSIFITLAAGALGVSAAHASGVSPYLPLNLAPEIERDVERVLLLGNQAILTRPIAAARVLDALPAACKRDQKLCERVTRYLERYKHSAVLSHASIEGAYVSESQQILPNRHGLTMDSAWSASASGFFQMGDYMILNGGFVADANNATPTGSMLSMGFDFAQLDVGYRDHWLSPFTDSSMLVSTNAATMPSITLSNYAPLTSWGFTYEIFMAEMSESSNIAYQGGTTTGYPRLAGLHLGIEPVPGWALSGNRLMQYGGGERGGTGPGDFFNALFRPHDYDNTSDSLSSDAQFGNQLAAWTSRMVFPGRVPFAVYFEYAGEDTSYSGNYRIGNSSLSLGIDFPRLWDTFDATYEVSEWQNGWYVHGIYRDGLTNEGHVIGHWFGDEREKQDGVGGQSHMLRLGWQPHFGGIAELRYRTLANANYGSVAYTRAQDVTLRYSYPWRNTLLGGEVQMGRDVFGDDYSRVAAFARFGAAFTAARASADDDDTDVASIDYFLDAGGSASRVRAEISDGAPKYVTDPSFAPHLGLGARRPVSEHSDLGARIEFDEIESELLIAVRALDYRYRLSKHVAFTAFVGAARYDLPTPAFGYYGGVGAQWRNVMQHLDVSLDVRYGDKIARDKLLPTDPPSLPRPDEFYDLFGATLYFSYRL